MKKVLWIEFYDPITGEIVERHFASLQFGVIVTDNIVVFEKLDGERRVLHRNGRSINIEIHNA